jgi:hypothetical protein
MNKAIFSETSSALSKELDELKEQATKQETAQEARIKELERQVAVSEAAQHSATTHLSGKEKRFLQLAQERSDKFQSEVPTGTPAVQILQLGPQVADDQTTVRGLWFIRS